MSLTTSILLDHRFIENTVRKQDGEKKEENKQSGILINFPRTTSVIIWVMIPFHFLIGLSFLCGHVLARSEFIYESKANDEVIARQYDYLSRLRMLKSSINGTLLTCVGTHEENLDVVDQTEIVEGNTAECIVPLIKDADKFLDYTLEKFPGPNILNFHWVKCGRFSTRTEMDENEWSDDEVYYSTFFKLMPSFPFPSMEHQLGLVYRAYYASFSRLKAEFILDGHNETIAIKMALVKATGHENCSPNTSAGALFWFILMSTIGYGNTTPSTLGGQILIYTVGLMSILLFSSVVGNAGSILIAIFDDFALHVLKAPKLVNGFTAAFFWFILFTSHLFLVALITIAYLHYYDGLEDPPLQHVVWFAFISLTTVGFGDLHIRHFTFESESMFFVPLCCLIGFVLLATFLLKLQTAVVAVVSELSYDPSSLSAVLERSRHTPQRPRKEESRVSDQQSEDQSSDNISDTSSK